jgi:hypothetical protein
LLGSGDMPRHALRSFFERVIIASLPLVVPACGGAKSGNDMGVVVAPTDMADSTVAEDMTGGGGGGGGGGAGGDLDMASIDMDTCEIDHPTVDVYVPAAFIPDAGHFNTLCVSNGSPCDMFCPDPRSGTMAYNSCCSPMPSDMKGYYKVTCVYNCGIAGRRPEGLDDVVVSGGCSVGHYFAAQAHLEAASVHAFRTLARELSAHGAPEHLVAAARRALRDEVRHARATRKMALAHGSRPSPVTASRTTTRSLEEIAVENIAEGCVRETYGALLANWQARAAADPAVREMMAAIADDETRHAELAWAVDAWARTKLDAAARRRVREARAAAIAALADEVAVAPSPALAERLGLPDATLARHFVDTASRELWV